MRKNTPAFFILFLLSILSASCSAQQTDSIVVAFWNLENLFDTVDDPATFDEEFTPLGEKEWTEEKLQKKMKNLSQGIRAMNEGNGPDILGVCEVEHESLLKNMIDQNLSDKNYGISYVESSDGRGIDNGLIYNADRFKLLNTDAESVPLPEGIDTREILISTMLLNSGDTVFVLVNHWPSRRGGEDASEDFRKSAAQIVKSITNRLAAESSNSKIIILGDFNDEPSNASLLEVLGAQQLNCGEISVDEDNLYNLAYEFEKQGLGSYKYRDNWNMLDQIIISASLTGKEGLQYVCNSFEIFKPEFLVEKEGRFAGTPFPTYGGRKYLGGYSDHFPVVAKFLIKN